jgi:protein-glutamine gamma-glutamyltransferase
VAALARSLVAGVPEGWRQIEAVIDALRQGYVHDRSCTVARGCSDVVAEFLLRSRRGPDYLFATSAAVLLRSLGYPVRVVSGLYAAPERYDPKTRHTAVGRDDIHFWAQVRLPDGLWVAIEPTPGYTLLGPARSWSKRLHAVLLAAWHWASDHWLPLLGAWAGFMLIWWRRREVLDRLVTLEWQLRRRRNTRCYVVETLRLVERRSSWAGRPRPAGQTPVCWFRPFAAAVPREVYHTLEHLVRFSDWAVYAPVGREAPFAAADGEIQTACQQVVACWTLRRFRALARSAHFGGSSS